MRCEYCQKEYPVEERLVGQEVRCPACGMPNCCSDRRVLIVCPHCHRELEGELWMLGDTAECTYCGREMRLSRPENPGDEFPNAYLPAFYVLGNYTIKRCVGIGGMGEVYLAHHNLLDRDCALKLLRPERSDSGMEIAFDAMISEAQMACRINSPNIIAVMDAQLDKVRNFAYIVMEYVEGTNIEDLINARPMSEDYVLNIAKEVTLALIEAAKFDIVHRDIKPANIMITNSGETKLADLGIAKSGQKATTNSGGRITGTIHYAAPEQLLSSDDVDARADIYSLGATMYHMLSGRRPFDGSSIKNVISQVLKGNFIPLDKAAPNISKETCRLVSSMMAMNASSRPANAVKLLEEIEKIIRIRSRKSFSFKGIKLPAPKVLIAGAAALFLLILLPLLFLSGKKEQKAEVKTPPPAAKTPSVPKPAFQPRIVMPEKKAEPSQQEQPKPQAAAPKAQEQPKPQAAAPKAQEQPKPQAAAPKAQEQPKPSRRTQTKVPPQPPRMSKVNYIGLLLLAAWLFSGIKVLQLIKGKKFRTLKPVVEYSEYLDLAALVAGPLVYLYLVYYKVFRNKVQKILKKRTNLPIILNSQGQPAFQESEDSENGETILYLRTLLADAIKLHTSDIFLDPKTGDVSVLRFRVDGGLRTIEEIDSESGAKVINVIKVAAGMDITERRRPQDGSFSLTGPLGDISLRVATVGTFSGEKVAMRILGDDSGPKTLADAGISGRELVIMEQAAKLPSGMVLICGPTGSGKTTTLYAMLNSIDYSIKNVISIEDPIEHIMSSISQMEVNEPAGITFSKLLRNALRQNPDIICLGEIRDEDTAQVAIHAAQTGHLIIATLHSNDNIGTIDRLANLNIPLRSIAGTLRVVISQRLVRKLCSCKKSRAVTPEEAAEFQKYGISCSKVYIPGGCAKCGNTGYAGRMALFDILTVGDELRALLEDEHTILSNVQKKLEQNSKGNAMVKSGYNFVAQGITSLEEVKRVTLELDN